MGTGQMVLLGAAAFSLGAAGLYVADSMPPGSASWVVLITSMALTTSPALLVGIAARRRRSANGSAPVRST